MSKQNKPRNPDHVRRTNQPGPDNEVIQERIKSLLTPVRLWAVSLLPPSGTPGPAAQFAGHGRGGLDDVMASGSFSV